MKRQAMGCRSSLSDDQRQQGPLIDGLALAREGDVTLLNDPVLVGELRAYRLSGCRVARFATGAQRRHDDTVIATAISWHGVTRGIRKPVTAEIARWA
ncbi:MAG: hypothetical protein LC121_18020 [Anaerolineae bacterium]|nr:hypothetical protein [Anaerolineae bacterium]